MMLNDVAWFNRIYFILIFKLEAVYPNINRIKDVFLIKRTGLLLSCDLVHVIPIIVG